MEADTAPQESLVKVDANPPDVVGEDGILSLMTFFMEYLRAASSSVLESELSS
jgi:hypothetical protein